MTLTVIELHRILTTMPIDTDVVIRVSKPGFGETPSVGIKGAHAGFDWDKGKLIIEPNVELVPKSQNETVYEEASDLIMWLASKPLKKETFEVSRAKKIVKSLGITDEQLLRHQKVYHQPRKGN